MITRELKLKINKAQETKLNEWFLICTSIYNWSIRKIELNAGDKIYFSKFEFQNILANHSQTIGIPSHTINGMLGRAFIAWERCFNKIAQKPKFKGIRNKLRSIPFPDPLRPPKNNRIPVPLLGKVKFHKQSLPEGKIKNGRIIKRASGWYLQLTIDTKHTFEVKETTEKVGIDTGFKHLAILSNGEKFENKRFFIRSQERLGQAQRGRNKQLSARLNERIKNQRKDFNHKVSRQIVETFNEIYITNDSFAGQSKLFGKSVMDAGISQLRTFILYKGDNHGRTVKLVDSKYTTMTCSECRALTGPTGLSVLNVRNWECSACGAHHDRDVNAAMNVLNSGLGCSLVNPKLLSNVNENQVLR